MKYFKKSLGKHGAYAKYYLQERSEEVDPQRKFPTMVICPGGAFMMTSFREDEAVTLRFLDEGFNVVVVHYATDGADKYLGKSSDQLPEKPVSLFPNSLVELAQAVSYLKEHATDWGVNENYICVGGFSAGANIAAQLGVYWREEWLEKLVGKPKELYRPTHLMLGYGAYDLSDKGNSRYTKMPEIMSYTRHALFGTVDPSKEQLDKVNPIKHISTFTPPTFLWQTAKDEIVNVQGTINFEQALFNENIPFEAHIFNEGGHGLSLADLRTGNDQKQVNFQVSKWFDLFIEWLAPHKSQRATFFSAD